MNLYIETDSNGNAINHPAFEDNLFAAFGKIPDHWEPFVRPELSIPLVNVYQHLNSPDPIYKKVDGVWTDTWDIVDLTDEEKAAKQQAVKDEWNSKPNRFNFTAWTFDEETCQYVSPTPYPKDDKDYYWQGSTNSWQIVPERPVDRVNTYMLNVSTGEWQIAPEVPTDSVDGKTYYFDQQTWSWKKI
jgi:hypothetical protein